MKRLLFNPLSPLLILASLWLAAPARAQSVTLEWDANTESDLAGYKVYFGTASRTYGAPITLGKVTTYTVTGLTPGTTYYFAVTAYNTAGLESGYSNEVSATIPSQTSKCDANGDGTINAVDLQVLINVILGTRTPAAGNDLNGDGSVDVLDLQILCNVILGTRSCPS
jgi:hypothetical protein